MPKTLRERLASMTSAEIEAAWRTTADGDAACKAAGLLEVVDDRAEALAIMEERLPVLAQALEEIRRREEEVVPTVRKDRRLDLRSNAMIDLSELTKPLVRKQQVQYEPVVACYATNPEAPPEPPATWVIWAPRARRLPDPPHAVLGFDPGSGAPFEAFDVAFDTPHGLCVVNVRWELGVRVRSRLVFKTDAPGPDCGIAFEVSARVADGREIQEVQHATRRWLGDRDGAHVFVPFDPTATRWFFRIAERTA